MTMSTSAVAASAKRKAYANVVLPLFIISIIAYMDRVNLSYAKLTMDIDLKLSDQTYGLGASIFFVGYLLFEVPGALIAERFSPRWWLARIMITWGIASGLMAFMTTAWHFYVLRFLLGVAEASLYPVLYASCIPRWFSAKDRPQAIAVMLTSLQVSSIIGAPLAGWLLGVSLLGLHGWQCLFILEAIPAIVFGVILVFWLADWPKDARWLTAPEKQFLTEQYEREVAVKSAVKHYTVWQALREKEVLKLSATYFLWITGFWGFTYWIPTELEKASGWSHLAIGWTIAVSMCLSLAFMVWISHHSAKTGEKRWHGAVGLFIAAAGMLLGTMTDSPGWAIAVTCLAAIGVYAPFGVWWSYPTTFLSGAAAAGAIGLINSCGNVGGVVGPSLLGWLSDVTGSRSFGWIYLAFSLTCAGLLILTFKRHVPTDSVA
jgi:MFS transporter, ACS family, tartrate transporter